MKLFTVSEAAAAALMVRLTRSVLPRYRQLPRLIPLLGAIFGFALLSACTNPMSFPVTKSAQKSYATKNVNIILVTPENIARYRDPPKRHLRSGAANPPADPHPYAYRLGVGDQLRIQVWTDPERTQSSSDGGTEQGPIVDESGNIFYPFIGVVHAAGRTVGELRVELTKRLKKFIADPQIEIGVSVFNAHHATITGEVENPGPTTLTNVPLRLLDIVNAAQYTSSADLSHVTIQRGRSRYTVDLLSYIRSGRRGQNPILLPGDVVHVPPLIGNKVFTFGETKTSEYPLGDTRKSLTEVLAAAGGIDRLRADARGVFVFRRNGSTPDGFDVYQFNLHTASALVLATDFGMAPLDIVFVTNDPITRWNDSVGKLLSPFAGLVQARSAADALSK